MDTTKVDTKPGIFLKPRSDPAPGDQIYLIHFITGNPGLIPYYRPFLEKLNDELIASSTARIYISGHSLLGFDLLKHDPKMYTLKDQVADQERKLEHYVRRTPFQTPKIILMGHSTGAWIMLELIQRNPHEYNLDIIGGILLFPTIIDIANSPAGRITSVSRCAFLCLEES